MLLSSLLGVRYPILNAPMTPQAGGALARAVAESGAFGMLGFDEGEPVESRRAQIALIHAGAPDIAFGIGMVAWVLEQQPELLDLAIEARPKMVAISFGDPAPYVARFHAAGILVASQVQSRAWAETALAAGVDILVAQGTEAGGHTGAVGTLPLLQIVLELAGSTPVIAAGGIATGRGLAAVLTAGACGAWIGTPFLAATEARTNAAAQARITAADETGTILTSAFDRVQHKAWPAEFRGRALRNAFTDQWDQAPDAISDAAEASFQAARARQDYDIAHLYAGQTVGLVRKTEPAAAIVERIVYGAGAALRAARDIAF
jgi:nitronate monooxygenase